MMVARDLPYSSTKRCASSVTSSPNALAFCTSSLRILPGFRLGATHSATSWSVSAPLAILKGPTTFFEGHKQFLAFLLQVAVLAPFVLALVKVAMSNMMGQMVILYLMDVLYSYGLCTVVEESSGDESSWSADERHCHRMEHLREQHLASNYHTENRSPTPLLDFPTSSDEDEDDERMDINEDCNKKAKNCLCPSKKVVRPLRIARGADTDQDVAE